MSIKGGSVSVTLQSTTSSLDEVVVVGYGTQKKKDVIGSVASVNGKVISEKPVQSFDQALGGRAAGVQVTVPNGVLNNPPVIRVRGTNSISLSSYPLIVVDGIPSFSGDQSSTNAASNALSSINPADIESIDIAKDAAASAIYGSRAANGVVFVTTKRGKQGKAKVIYDGRVDFTTVQRLPELLDAFQYTDLKNEGLKNAGSYNAATNYYSLSNDANGNPINTRWYDYVYRNAFSHAHTLSVSGANEATNYYFSFGYTDQQGIIQQNNFKRINVLANLDHKVNKWISLNGKIAFSNGLDLSAASSGSLPGEGFNTGGLGRIPLVNAPNVSPYNNDGSYNINSSGLVGVMSNKVAQVGFYNPVASLAYNRSNTENNRFQGNFSAQIKPVSWFAIKTTYGVDWITADNQIFNSPYSGESWGVGSATSIFAKTKRWVWTNTAQFDKTIYQKHNVSLLLGNEQQKTESESYGLGRSTISDPFYTNIQGSYGVPSASGLGIGENFLYSDFGRFQYNFDKKYFISANVRKDGASQLSSNFKYGTFWGVSAAWEAQKENFWSSLKFDRILSSFKLRASYGKVGNISGLSNFGTLSTYTGSLYNANPTLSFTNAGNSNLTWETSTKTDIGLSFGILKDRITSSITYYTNDITGLILSVPQPPSAGLPNSINANVGSMYNRGVEFEINALVLEIGKFSWNSSFNITYNKNQVVELAPNSGVNSITATTSSLETSAITVPGQPIAMTYVVRTKGVDPTTGRRIFVNAAGKDVYFQHVAPSGQFRFSYADGTVAPNVSGADAQVYMPTQPKYFGGWQNTFRYKEFELSADFTYQFGNYIYYGTNAGLRDQRYWNNSTDVLRRWQKGGDVTDIPKLINGDNISNGSSFPLDINVFKGDFVKLRTLTLSYTFPKVVINALKLSNARVYVSGNNLAIFTKYPGPDPEVSSNGNGTTNFGVDRNTVANARQISIGFNVAF